MSASNFPTPADLPSTRPPAGSRRALLIPLLVVTATVAGLGVLLVLALRPGGAGQARAAANASAGDLNVGRQLFAGSCAVCHGSSGRGMPEQGVPLRGSAFLAHNNDAALVAFLRTGRKSNDRATLTGRVMPPRGGNPQLSDEDLADIVRYLRSLQQVASLN